MVVACSDGRSKERDLEAEVVGSWAGRLAAAGAAAGRRDSGDHRFVVRVSSHGPSRLSICSRLQRGENSIACSGWRIRERQIWMVMGLMISGARSTAKCVLSGASRRRPGGRWDGLASRARRLGDVRATISRKLGGFSQSSLPEKYVDPLSNPAG